MDGELAERDAKTISSVIARLGVANVRAFGLEWEDCEELRVLRNRLDKQMTKFRKTNPEFYAGYRSARVIVDRGGSGGAVQPSPAKATVSA